VTEAGIALELAPASNVALGVYPTAADVPLRRLYEAGAIIALSADDPLLFVARLTDQYRIGREDHGMDDAMLADLARSSVRASLASEASKRQWLAEIDDWLAAPPPAG